MVAVVILAAGHSTRMGSPKALLPDREGCSFVARIVRTCVEAGCASITVVTGTAHDSIRAVLASDAPGVPVRLARNADPDRGQLSSIWTGLDDVAGTGADAMLLALVDAPFFSAATVRAVLDGHRATGAPVVRPARGMEHGHPVLFDAAVFPALRAADLRTGAKPVVRGLADRVLNVPVDDDGAFLDVDTPDDHARAVLREEETKP